MKSKLLIGILLLSLGLNFYLGYHVLRLYSDIDGYAQQERIVGDGMDYLTKMVISCHPTDVQVVESLKEFQKTQTDVSQDAFTMYPFRFQFGADHKLVDVRFIGTIK